VDESAQSLRAVDWTTQQAMVHSRMLTVCHVLPYDRPDPPLSDSIRAGLAGRGRSLVDGAVRRARQADRHLAVEGRLERGHATEVLLGLAAGADEIVVGSRGAGAGGFALLRTGSVGPQLVAHALGPVTVVDGGSTDRSEVVIGVDGSGSGRAALDYGFRFASDHRLSVHAVHACPAPMPMPTPTPMPNLPFPGPPYRTEEPAPERAAARELVRDAVAMWTSKYPDVPVRTTIAAGHPAATLIEASLGSTLLVVGSRGHGGFTGLFLGSVSQAVLRHANCPVTIAR
jgi:nucleotide-binding universal stress UspA family protein